MALTKVVTDIIGGDTLSGISGSFRGELSSSVYLRQVSSTISGSLGANASVIRTLDRTTISGSIPQALATNSSPTFAAGTITGDLSVGGTLTAQEVHTEFESASILFTSGSTRFGDDTTDTHRVTGSMDVSGSLDIPHGNLSVIDRVGVGTNNPTVALEVFGSADQQIRIDSTGNRAQLQFDGKKTSDAEFAEINFANDGDSAAAIHAMRDGANDAARLAFFTQPTGGSVTERMSIDSGGNVGIGTTNPTKLLDLESSGTEASMDLTNDAQTYRIGINDFGTGDDRIFISDVTKDITRMSITTAGSTLLSGSLQIESDLDTPLTIKKTSNGEMFIRFMNSSGAMRGALIYRTDSDLFSLRTANTTALNIDSSQLVSFNGDIELNGSSTRQIRFDDGSESEGAIVFDELTDGFIFKVGGTSSVGKTDALKILNDGNVGIKVTPEDWDAANAFAVLQMGVGACVAGYGANPNAIFGNNIYFDDTNNRWQYITTNEATLYTQNDDGKHTWFTSTSGTADSEATLNQRMVILNDGNVGINVTNPTAAKLQVETSANGERCADFNHSESSVDSQDEIMRCRFSGTGAPAGGRFIAFEDSQARTGMIQMADGDNVAYTVGSSDINTKKNFEDWDENVLEHFKALKPKRFHYKRQEDSKPKNKGYIAQDVKDAFPEAYPLSGFKEEGEEKQYYGFNPSGMVIYLMKAVQELTSQIDVLKSQISGSSDFNALKTAVSGSN